MPLTFVRRFPLTTATTTAIVLLSVLPFNDVPEFVGDVPLMDKWTHMVMYGGLSFVAWMEAWRRRLSLGHALLLANLFPVLWGGLMELVQAPIPYRGCDVWDFVANSIGASIATLLVLAYKISTRRQ